MSDLASLYIRVDSTGVVTASKDLDALTGKSRTAEKATQSVTSSFQSQIAVVRQLAAAYGAYKIAQYIKDATMLAARYETLGVVMRVVGNNAGYSGAQMETFARGLEKAGISMIEARQTLTRMVQANLDLAQSSKLARVAQDAAVIGNINSSEAFQRMVYGIQSGQVEILRTIGLNVNFENSYQKVAIATGRAAKEFSEAEKAQIRMNTVMDAGKTIAGTYESAMGTAGKQVLSLQRHLDNLKVAFGLAFTPALAELIEQVTGAVSDLNGELSGDSQDAIRDWGNKFRLVLISIEAEITRLAMLVDKIGGTKTSLDMLGSGIGSALGISKKTSPVLGAILGSKEEFEAAADANINYENRYNASERALEALAIKYNKIEASIGVKSKVKDGNVSSITGAAGALNKGSDASGDSTKGAREAAREAERIAREEQKLHEFLVDLYIQDEARKWEELEKYEKDYLESLHTRAEEEAKVYEQQKQGAESYRQMMAQMNIDIAEGHERAVMQIMESDRQQYENINKLLDSGVINFDEAMKAYEKLAQITGKSIQEVFENDLVDATKTFIKQVNTISGAFWELGYAFSQMAGTYEKGSEGAKKWEEAARAMEIAQRALAVVNAVAAVASAATAPFPAGFVSMAAMLGSMVSLLATIGEGIGGSSASVSTANLPKSTVLGAENGTGSESVSNSFELLKDIYDIEDTKLTKIYNELKDLNSNITGLVTTIFRTGGISAEGMGISVGTETGRAEKLLSSYIYQDAGFLTKIGNFLNQPILDIGNFIFGGKVKKSVTETGISFGDQSIADILSGGMNAQQYADIKTTKSGWFGSKKTSTSTQYGELDSEVSLMFDKVFQGMGQSLVFFAENLGTSVNDVMNYTFEKTKLDLKDMTAEEMNKAISEYISAASDNAVSALFGDIVGKYQRLSEGLLETATRLIVDKEVVASIMEDTGKSLTGTVPEMIAFSESLIEIAGSLDSLSEAAESYIDKFYTDAEKFASTKQSIRDVAGILPRTREDYRRLVESIDLTSEVGKQAYYTLLALSDTADSYYSHIEDIANQRAEMEIQLLEAQGKTAEALAASRKKELEAMDESLRPLQELIWLTQDLGTSLETITTQTSTAINDLISNSSSAASEARSMASTYKGLIDTLTDAQVKIFGGGKAGAQERFSDIYKTAMTGDADAIGKMPGAIDILLTESLKSASTSLEYRRDQAKSYIALEQAKTVSTAMVNWEEYHATLLETQTKLLEEMRDELAEPSPDLIELQKHADLLGNIATLLQQQTAQVVQGNTYVHDQTGKIVAGNLLTQDQTGKIISQTSTIDTGNELVNKQTAQVITGNAVQDVIKNLDAQNTSYTSEMLSALVTGGSTQTSSLVSILSSSTTIVSLLGQLITVFEDNEKNVSLKEIELSKSEYTKAMADVTETNKALQDAIADTSSARALEQQLLAAYGQAAQVSNWAASLYDQSPTAANKALYMGKYAAANTAYETYAAAAADYKTAQAQQEALQTLASQQYTTAMALKSVTNKLIDTYNAEYPDDKISKLPSAGWKYGGIASGSESGYEATLHGTELVVSPKGKYPATVSRDNSELTAEVKGLRADIKTMTRLLKADTQKQVSLLNTLNDTGILQRVA